MPGRLLEFFTSTTTTPLLCYLFSLNLLQLTIIASTIFGMWLASVFLALILTIWTLHTETFVIEPRDDGNIAGNIFAEDRTLKLEAPPYGLQGLFFSFDRLPAKLQVASQLSTQETTFLTVFAFTNNSGLIFYVPYPEATTKYRSYQPLITDQANFLLKLNIHFPTPILIEHDYEICLINECT